MDTLLLWDIDGTLLSARAGLGQVSLDEFLEAARRATGKKDLLPPDNIHGSTDFAITKEILHNSGFNQIECDLFLFPVFVELNKLTSSASYIDKTRKAVPGAREALEALSKICLQTYGTGNLPSRAQAKARFFSLDKYLDAEIGGFGFWTKERAQFLSHAKNLAEAKHQKTLRAVVIGDTPRDIQGAREAGFLSVAVAGGFYTEAELQDADLVLSDWLEVSTLLEFLK